MADGYTKVTGTLRRAGKESAEGAEVVARAKLSVTRIIKGNRLVSTKNVDAYSEADGSIEFYVLRDCDARIYAEAEGYDKKPNGVWVTIPDADEVDLDDLQPPTSTPTIPAASQAALQAETAARQSAEAIYTQAITEDATIDVGDALRALILIDTSDGDVTATLQPAADVPNREVTFKKIADENLAIVDGNGSETIDGQLVYNLEMMNQTVKVVAVGSNWYVA